MTDFRPLPRTLLTCIAFLLLVLGAVHPAAAQLGTGSATVDLAVFTCAPGTDPQAERNLLETQCLEEASPYSLTIGDGSTWADGADTTGSAPQVTRFDQVPAGGIQLVLALPESLRGPMVYCFETPADAVGAYGLVATYRLQDDWDKYDYVAFARDLADDSALTCQLFTFMSEAEATPARATEPGLDVAFRGCPADVDTTASVDALDAACTAELAAVGLLVSNHAGYTQMAGDLGTRSIERHVWMDGVPAGPIFITPTVPAGYAHPLVFCAEGNDPLQPLTTDMSGAATWDLTEGATLTCRVYLVPGETAATPAATPGATPVT